MVLFRVILLASAPALYWIWFFYRQDHWEPEPKRLVLWLFVLGALTAAPVYLLQRWLPALPNAAVDLLVRVAVLEELFKFLPIWWFACRNREFNEPMDGILYAVAAALGFATVENVIYALRLGERLILYRAFTATLAHLAFSGLVGYHLGKAKFVPTRQRLLVLRALAAVILMHAAYDLLLDYGSDPAAPPAVARGTIVIMVPTLLGLLCWAAHKAGRASPFRDR